MVKVAVVGSYGVGMSMRVPRIPVPGETVIGGEFSLGHGGKGSNQAIAARRLGADVELITCIGVDKFGDEALQLWASEGIRTGRVKRTSLPTMVGVILVEPNGENRIAVAAGALEDLEPDDLKGFADAMSDADVCLVSLEIPLTTACTALSLARRAGTRTVLNPAPAAQLPDDVWSMVDVLTPNLTEAQVLCGSGSGSPEVLAHSMRSHYGGVLVITLGEQGAYLDDGLGRAGIVPAAETARVVDTTGAGDTFSAALAVALAEGSEVEAAVAFANSAAGICVSRPEVVPALPYRHEVADQSETARR